MWVQIFLLISVIQSVCVGYEWFSEHRAWKAMDAKLDVSMFRKKPNSFVLDSKKMAIFGDYVSLDLVYSGAKETRLPIHLVGILSSEEEGASEVLIELPDKTQKMYHEGERLPGGEMIQRILKEQVYLLHNGVLEYLFLPEKKLIYRAPGRSLTIEDK